MRHRQRGCVERQRILTRWLDDSSGTVKVADYPDVQVNAENHPIAHTDSHGIALMPRLRSFEYNHISIEQAHLPLDAQIGSVQVDARPACRRGVLIDLPVHSTRGALLTIVLKDGSPLPAGATVKRIRGSQVFPVAMRGEVYVTGLKITIGFAPSGMARPVSSISICRGKTIRCRISNRSYALSANRMASSLPDDPDERSRFRRRVGGGDLYRFRDWCRLGSYNQLSSSPVDSTITVQCSKDSGPPTILNYTILLSAGQSGSFAPRKMARGANRFR
jgi:hypothetical protein